MFEWKQQFSCGIPKIDEQHKKLFQLGQEIYDLVNINDGYDHYDEVMNTLLELKDYTVYHFNFEEKAMLMYNFYDFENHKIEHDQFVEKIKDFLKNEEKIDENQKEVCNEMLKFIGSWICEHILCSDMKYKEHLKKLTSA